MTNTCRLLLTAMLLLGKTTAAFAAEIFVVNSASRTLTRIDTMEGTTDNSFAQLGLTPNLLDLDEEHIYIACSGDNAIQVLDRETGAQIRYLPVAASCNPYDVLKVGEFLYVSGLFTDKTYKLSLQSNSVVGTLEVGTAPEGLATDGTYLFVCNTGGYSNNYAGSSVSVIALDSFTVEATIPVWTNPQYAVFRNGFLHVSCTGNWMDIAGKVDVIDIASLERVQRLDIGGHPGNLWISPTGTAYVSEGLDTGLYSYNASSYEVYHGAANPLPYSASMLHGDAGIFALLEQNWASNSIVRSYQSDWSPLATYTVGLSATDIVVAEPQTPVSEDLLPLPVSVLYPNPLPRSTPLKVATAESGSAELRLYNLRGQLVQRHTLKPGTQEIMPAELPSGVYLYRFLQSGSERSGKLLLLD